MDKSLKVYILCLTKVFVKSNQEDSQWGAINETSFVMY